MHARQAAAGRPVGKALLEDNPMEAGDWFLPAGAGSVIKDFELAGVQVLNPLGPGG